VRASSSEVEGEDGWIYYVHERAAAAWWSERGAWNSLQ
jgi:hypothetical protein